MKYLHFITNAVRLWTKLEISFGVFSALTIVIFNVFMCSIKYGFTLQDQFINVGRCFIKLFCWIKICFLFKNALLIKRYSFVPTKHYFLPTTNPLHLNFLLMSASYVWGDSKTRKGLLFTTTHIVLRNLTFIVIYILKENTRAKKSSKS